jgi:hypothetical protein
MFQKSHYLHLSWPWGNIGEESAGIFFHQDLQKRGAFAFHIPVDIRHTLLWHTAFWGRQSELVGNGAR